MSYIKTFPMQHSSILRVNSEREMIQIDPDYQRKGDIWNLEKRQLLMDSIINDFDIPKLYFHVIPRSMNLPYEYSIVDGRQRLEAIWKYMENEFKLSEDFVYISDERINISGMTYSELSLKYPKIKIRFDSFVLPIICVETDEIDLIEDMFSRLNEAVPLNAAEKRNAIGGSMATEIRSLEQHPFFKQKVIFKNNRFQHQEVIARLLFLEYSKERFGKIIDTKKPYLDAMVKEFKENKDLQSYKYREVVEKTLNRLVNIFQDKDSLLRSQSSITIYYLTIQDELLLNTSRREIENFQEKLKQNRIIASSNISSADFDLLEYERLSQQGTNDSTSIRERVRILRDFLLSTSK